MNKTKFIKEHVYNIQYENYNWQHYSADTIEEAIAMCREEHPDSKIYRVEYIGTSTRKSTKTITVDI